MITAEDQAEMTCRSFEWFGEVTEQRRIDDRGPQRTTRYEEAAFARPASEQVAARFTCLPTRLGAAQEVEGGSH